MIYTLLRKRKLLAAVGSVIAGLALTAAGSPAASSTISSKYALANRCLALQPAAGGPAFAAFFAKATGLGTYMFHDQDGRLLSASGPTVTRVSEPGPPAEWAPQPVAGGAFLIRSTANGRRLAVSAGRLALTGAGTRFVFRSASGCTPFPEAGLDAAGRPARGTNRNGSVFGFVDAHLHITADMRAGGRVIHGEAFDRFGIPTALGGDARDHGPDGSLDLTGNLLRTGIPFGTHDTHGWPTFAGWPTSGTQTHQQTYYVWLERAWMAGERLVVAQAVDDSAICRIEPLRNPGGCDETRSIKRQIRRLRALQNYVDAQSGGPGRGWFRIVESPAQARRVIERGKLAVVIGIESSDLFGCSERHGRAQCTRRDVNRGLRSYRRLGVRSMFVAHWVNNGFSGAALEGGAKGAFINIFNFIQTGNFFETGRCPARGQGETVHTLSPIEVQVLTGLFPVTKPIAGVKMPHYPARKQCNSRGLTPLGRYLIRRMIATHMLIEADHMSERAREALLSIAARNNYPLVSSHNGTGGLWSPGELRRLYRGGGFAAVTPGTAPLLASKLLRMGRFRKRGSFFGVGIGTDTGGFAGQPGPRSDAAQNPLRYPFKSYDGRVTFERERSGQRTFDLNMDGVAHYGLMADLVADMDRGSSRRALPPLFRSAEAYLRTWQRAVRHR